ncbi:multicopper oxidase family protein [Actinoplanes missouriensis]|uniref:multicopper oxidase family protein n=1 Tax=Actinoplanes missouriensis TaxID=1866 RepID=UPI00340AEFFE
MITGTLIALDMVLSVVAAAGWLGAGAAAAGGHRRTARIAGTAALAVTLTRAGTVIPLAGAGWWFAAEKVVLAAPLALAGVVVAVPRLVRPPGDIRRATLALLFAGYAQSSALLVTVLHGYPLSTGVVLLALAGVAAATLVTGRLTGARPSRAVSRGAGVATLAAATAGIGLMVDAGAAAPVHDHSGLSAPAVGEPTRRFTLTAGTAVVKAGGRDVAAWAFDGRVPGPPLTATLGDVIEVTLLNRDIERGATLHWHGYDVPNSQDGVPGVTQDVVLPGERFVYRFRAEQAGTYWYHTHAVSDVGVRMGLYGTLVVTPAGSAPVVDVVVPVHTLGGRLLPDPVVQPVSVGRAVRLRLINTDSGTHRFALAGTGFQVAAIDGMDLRGPPEVTETAVLIPAGGRYDLTFNAEGSSVGLFVDGRIVWSTGPVTAETGGWTVLDPLTYGASEPAPWARIDREFTLVLDRGLDLRGLLPRYAHTVNGAAAPGIADQTVRYGEIVKLTIVNRSLVAHPWHLHGHHVRVLRRDGHEAQGSPLWLDSFDVLPGQVWEVAFRADNPGMWANHCHNLPHAEQGMTLHLRYG